MSQLQDRIAQFRKMANDDPENELGHYRLGQLLAAARARQLTNPAMSDAIGRRIEQPVCADCWTEWLKNYSIKVIKELRLDLSTEHGQAEYDRYMREFLGLD